MNFDQWIQQQFPDAAIQLQALTDDASARNYYRFCAGSHTYIAVNSKLPFEKNQAYIDIARAFKKLEIHTPDIIASDLNQGFLIVSDLGDNLFSHAVTVTNVNQHHLHALNLLFKMQAAEKTLHSIGKFDADFMLMECHIFKEWFLENYLELQLNSQQLTELNNLFCLLIENNIEQPQGMMHRDYHCRNLILMEDHDIGVLDFQDALIGPMTYDSVSLLKDCYITWPKNTVIALALQHHQQLCQHTQLSISKEQYFQWFDLSGLQRHLKVLGIFARLHLRDHKSNYLQYLDNVVNYIIDVTVTMNTLDPLHQLFVNAIIPRMNEKF